MTACRTSPAAGRVICFAPHPDDEVLGAGGTLVLHAHQGDAIRIVLGTDGIAGDPRQRFAAASYAELRRAESRRAALVAGWPEPVFWGLPDSCEVVEADRVRVAALCAEQLREFRPDVVYLPWSGDDHQDHLVLHECVVRALRTVGFGGAAWGYEVWAPIPRPDLVVDISAVEADKRAALTCFATQNSYSDLAHMVFGLNAYRSLLLERSGSFGEAFQRIDPVVG
jgi:LmbE family N-acetylglucosaminyl deacetylase